MPRPQPSEDYEEWMQRCQDMGHDEGQCDLWWEEYAGDGTPPAEAVRYPLVMRAVYGTPWALEPGKLADILALLQLRAQGQRLTADEIKARVGSPRANAPVKAGKVAVLPLFGTLEIGRAHV